MKKNNKGYSGFDRDNFPSPHYFNRRKGEEDLSMFSISKSFFGKLTVRVSKELTASESEMAAKLAGFKPVRLEVESSGAQNRVSFVADNNYTVEISYLDFKDCFGKLEKKMVKLMTDALLSG